MDNREPKGFVKRLFALSLEDRDHILAICADLSENTAQLARANKTIEIVAAQRDRALDAVEKLREPVRWFADEMEARLKENDWKKPWPKMSNKQLLEQMDEHGPKLVKAVIIGDPQKIIRRAANLANYAMMIADKARAVLAATEHKP